MCDHLTTSDVLDLLNNLHITLDIEKDEEGGNTLRVTLEVWDSGQQRGYRVIDVASVQIPKNP